MPRFYRVEHIETKRGIYTSEYTPITDMMASPRHPMPQNDSMLNDNWLRLNHCHMQWNCSIRFGFSSIEQLKNWIYQDELLRDLDTALFILHIYEVPKIYEGNTQCVIHDRYHLDSNIVETISLLSLCQQQIN